MVGIEAADLIPAKPVSSRGHAEAPKSSNSLGDHRILLAIIEFS
jgi:hypothetical protein